jgi:hypothetical protein
MASVCARISVGGRTLYPTEVFDTYWRFAAARQAIYEARQAGQPGPWTSDHILRKYRFTNCYRAADRVSQFLISKVAYAGPQEPTEIFFRTLLFKSFNRVSTWVTLAEHIGEISWRTYDFEVYKSVLDEAFASGQPLYSAAYVVPPPQMGETRKHANHLRLLELLMANGAAALVGSARTMRCAFENLVGFPAIGDFLGYQYLIDLNYSELLSFSEMDFVVAGPGARDGVRKCFGPESAGVEEDLIRYAADTQECHFEHLA